MSRFQFVADHLHAFEVKWLCAVVEVARSSFYAWLAGADGRAARRAADEALAERIRAVHDEDNTYGRRGSPPSSTTVRPRGSGSTTSGWLG
ncbi:hypothetical protein MMON_46950 [Mycolicibacterium monacense]|uniref:Transposase n=1 Tax=Mycolicibacterium monacense TaxID=85693 RepID=A0AAD1IYR4_MYCMB|nr:hypothetical protein MMON_46950 [Mycolicibacterium monacense]